MTSPEDRLRGALHTVEPAPLDPERIIRAARHRRAIGRARIGAAAAVVVVAGAVGIPLAGQIGQNDSGVTAAAPEAGTRAPEEASPAERPTAPLPSSAARPGPAAELIPGRTIRREAERWCIIDLTDTTAPECADRTEHSLRTTDAEGTEWLVVVAPSGPGTALLQVEQSSGWVNLRTSPVARSGEYWVGVVPSGRAPESASRLRALDSDGTEIWAAG
jgi:hypothetical protein